MKRTYWRKQQFMVNWIRNVQTTLIGVVHNRRNQSQQPATKLNHRSVHPQSNNDTLTIT